MITYILITSILINLINGLNLNKSILHDNYSNFISDYGIDLFEKEINWIHPNTFTGLETIEYMDLSHNQIEQLHNNTFNDMINLKELNLGYILFLVYNHI
jgi:hypothetical protein